MENNNNGLNVGKVILGLALVAGCAAYTYVKTKTARKQEVIEIHPNDICSQEEAVEDAK